MKKILFSITAGLLFSLVANVALAGDQVIGGGFGKGGVEINQNQVNCESPWLCSENNE